MNIESYYQDIMEYWKLLWNIHYRLSGQIWKIVNESLWIMNIENYYQDTVK